MHFKSYIPPGNIFIEIPGYKILIGRIVLMALVLFLVANLCACSAFLEVKNFFREKFTAEDDMKRAVETVEEFFNLIIDKDYEKAYGYLSSEDKEKGSIEDFVNEFRDVTDIISIDIKSVEVKSNIAVVCLDLTDFYDGDEKVYRDIEVSLVRGEDNGWKIVFWK